jgi:hypothetical protein
MSYSSLASNIEERLRIYSWCDAATIVSDSALFACSTQISRYFRACLRAQRRKPIEVSNHRISGSRSGSDAAARASSL